jgi:hypothetical protein
MLAGLFQGDQTGRGEEGVGMDGGVATFFGFSLLVSAKLR